MEVMIQSAGHRLDNDITDTCATYMPRSQCVLYLSGDDNRIMEGLLVAVHPLDILLQTFAVVEHLPPLLGITNQPLITDTVLVTAVIIAAGGCFAAVCLGYPSFAF